MKLLVKVEDKVWPARTKSPKATQRKQKWDPRGQKTGKGQYKPSPSLNRSEIIAFKKEHNTMWTWAFKTSVMLQIKSFVRQRLNELKSGALG